MTNADRSLTRIVRKDSSLIDPGCVVNYGVFSEASQESAERVEGNEADHERAQCQAGMIAHAHHDFGVFFFRLQHKHHY